MRRFTRITTFIVLIFVVAATAFSTELFAQSYSGTVFGRRSQRGYFDNNLDGSFDRRTNGDVLPGYPGGYADAIPTFINTVGELYNFLRQNYNSSNSIRKTGAAFIVNTMLGRNGSQARRTVSSADWNEVRQRLDDRQAAGKISWGGNTSGWINSYKQGRHNDDAFFRSYRNRPGIVVRDDSNRIVYRLVRACANPLGDTDNGLPQVRAWSVNDDSFIQRADASGNPTGGSLGTTVNNARPGERYVFRHRVVNQGPSSLTRNITTWRDFSYPGSSSNRANEATGGNGTGVNQAVRNLQVATPNIPSTAGGQQYCSRIHAQPRAYNSSSEMVGSRLCVNVAYNYDLTPHVSVGGDLGTNVEQGATGTTVDPRVENGGDTLTRDTNWQLIRFIVTPGSPSGSSSDRAPNNDADACATHDPRPGVENCELLRDGTQRFNAGNTDLDRFIHDTGDIPIGSRICFVLSVNTPTAAANPSWGHSQPACITVVKKPKIQVHGGDLWAGRHFAGDEGEFEPADIATGTSTVGGSVYGSWAEYGMLATGDIGGMASGAGLAGGRAQADASAANLNKLTFANTPAYGAYTTNPGFIPDYAGIYGGDGGGLPANFDVTPANGKYRSNSDVALSASGPIPKGRDTVIHANNITINNSIAYENGYGSLGDIPRLIIIAEGNIYISPEVEQLDAWLITKGTLYTCSQAAELTIDVCNRQLVVNGPVAAREVSLRRTHGSEAADSREKPAEVFNLRPDAMLSAYESALSSNRAQTVYQIELPPRF